MKSFLTIIAALFSFLIMIASGLQAQKATAKSFKVVPLGVLGGIDETNLSAYMVAPAGTNDYVCLDAGTIHEGIRKGIASGAFKASSSVVLKQYIKAYFISHAHLDHVSGLIINSPADSAKPVYATPSCMQMLENYYFNGEAWANFGDEGKGYLIKQYHFNTLQPGIKTPVAQTTMEVTAFPLSHVNPFESTAFLVNNGDDYVLYLGDTGADSIEHSQKLDSLWTAVAPLIRENKLKGIFIEVSFPNEQPVKSLFGHLTPLLFEQEMTKLADLVGAKGLAGFPVIITHNKPPVENIARLKKQLLAGNKLGLKLIFPVQGKMFLL